MLEFVVNDIGEEYFIIKRMLCPKCRGRLEVTMQALLVDALSEEERKKLNASNSTDRLHVECNDCGFAFSILFHHSAEYMGVLKERLSNINNFTKNRGDEL